MTIKDYVLNNEPTDINGWINRLKKDGLSKHESLIIHCAEDLNKITFNDNGKSVNELLTNSITN